MIVLYDANKFVMLVALTRKLIFGIIALKFVPAVFVKRVL